MTSAFAFYFALIILTHHLSTPSLPTHLANGAAGSVAARTPCPAGCVPSAPASRLTTIHHSPSIPGLANCIDVVADCADAAGAGHAAPTPAGKPLSAIFTRPATTAVRCPLTTLADHAGVGAPMTNSIPWTPLHTRMRRGTVLENFKWCSCVFRRADVVSLYRFHGVMFIWC